jgi:hypothetical protein
MDTLRLEFVDGEVRELDVWREDASLWLAWRDAGVRFGVPLEQAATLGLE